jgi:hypothetical protein
MKPTAAAAAAIALGLALAACAAPRWTKAGASPEQAANDYAQCNALAGEANARENAIESDILASRGHDWENQGTLSAHTDVYAAETQHRTGDIIRRCMEAKGYAEANK